MALVVLVLTFMISYSVKQKKASGDDDEYCFMLHNLCIILHHVLAQFVLCVRGEGGKWKANWIYFQVDIFSQIDLILPRLKRLSAVF